MKSIITQIISRQIFHSVNQIRLMRSMKPTPQQIPLKQNPAPHYKSNYQVEVDQKGIIISKLHQESKMLKKNELQLEELRKQYAELDRKYRSLYEVKSMNDLEFKNRHQSAVRYAGQLRNQVDAIKIELRDKRLEIGDLEADGEMLKSSFDTRNIQLQKYRSDLKSLISDVQELESQRKSFLATADTLQKSNLQLREQFHNLSLQNNAIQSKSNEMQKYLQQLQMEAQLLKNKIKDYEDKNNELDHVIQGIVNEISEIQNEIYQCQADVVDYQSHNATIMGNSEQFRSESIYNQKLGQAEIMKNNDLGKNIKQAENVLKIRVNQVEEGRNQLAALQGENDNLHRVNSQLQNDLEACRKHLQNLGLLNHQLITNLQNFSQQDRAVQQLINRRPKVDYMKSRVNQITTLDYGYNSKYTSRTDVTTTRSSRRSYRN